MSIYDSSHSSAGDSDVTKRAKVRLESLLHSEFKKLGFKCVIKTECPATFPEKKYHGDLGVLFRSRTELDLYHFFIIEIDGKVGHGTYKKDKREYVRDNIFYELGKGIVTCRIPLAKIQGENKLDDSELFKFIESDINDFYLKASDSRTKIMAETNRIFAIELAENMKGTKCLECGHPWLQHDLCGCDLKHAIQAKKRCECNQAFFRSDE